MTGCSFFAKKVTSSVDGVTTIAVYLFGTVA